MTGFADLDDPEDGFDASDPVVQILENLRLRIGFALIQIAQPALRARFERLRDDLELVRERIIRGEL